MQTQTMAKDLMFKLRLDAQDRKRLEAVAAHLSAPAATAVRMLIKEKYDAVEAARAVHLGREHHDVLWNFSGDPRATRGDIARSMNRIGYDATWGGLTRVLNELRAEGYVKRVRLNSEEAEADRKIGNWHGSAYVLTPKGRAYVDEHWTKDATKESKR